MRQISRMMMNIRGLAFDDPTSRGSQLSTLKFQGRNAAPDEELCQDMGIEQHPVDRA